MTESVPKRIVAQRVTQPKQKAKKLWIVISGVLLALCVTLSVFAVQQQREIKNLKKIEASWIYKYDNKVLQNNSLNAQLDALESELSDVRFQLDKANGTIPSDYNPPWHQNNATTTTTLPWE